MGAVGAGLGTGGLVVYDERTDPVELAAAVSRFLSVESCGQCPSCKLGTMAVTDLLDELGPETESRLFAQIAARLANAPDAARCFLPTQEQRVVASLIPDMKDPRMRTTERGLLVTKLVDLVVVRRNHAGQYGRARRASLLVGVGPVGLLARLCSVEHEASVDEIDQLRHQQASADSQVNASTGKCTKLRQGAPECLRQSPQ